jgi:hypothetical protein
MEGSKSKIGDEGMDVSGWGRGWGDGVRHFLMLQPEGV